MTKGTLSPEFRDLPSWASHNSAVNWARRADQTLLRHGVLYICLKKLGSFECEFFVGDVILGVGLGFFGLRHQVMGPNRKREPFVS